MLLDLKLPRIDGLDVLRAIRKHSCMRLIHVVMLTTSREDQDVVENHNLGANGCIRKPVNFDEFLHVVGQTGLYWLVLNEPAGPPR